MAQDKQPEGTPATTGQTAPQTPPQIQLDDSNVHATYANFCRVTGTPEEVLLDFGLNAEPLGYPRDPVAIGQRIITNYFTAKRLLAALAHTVKRHEEAFGVLETDIQKRFAAVHGRSAKE